MIFEYIGLERINGSLVVIDNVENAGFDELVEIRLDDGSVRHGRIIRIDGKLATIQVFEGTSGISGVNTRTRLTGKPLELCLSPDITGRVFDGLGRPIDGKGFSAASCCRDINGSAINPVRRVYPRNFIETGISSIDGLATLIRGQKLPIFSGSGMKHNELAVQIVRQASIAESEDFAIVFAAMGALANDGKVIDDARKYE